MVGCLRPVEQVGGSFEHETQFAVRWKQFTLIQNVQVWSPYNAFMLSSHGVGPPFHPPRVGSHSNVHLPSCVWYPLLTTFHSSDLVAVFGCNEVCEVGFVGLLLIVPGHLFTIDEQLHDGVKEVVVQATSMATSRAVPSGISMVNSRSRVVSLRSVWLLLGSKVKSKLLVVLVRALLVVLDMFKVFGISFRVTGRVCRSSSPTAQVLPAWCMRLIVFRTEWFSFAWHVFHLELPDVVCLGHHLSRRLSIWWLCRSPLLRLSWSG